MKINEAVKGTKAQVEKRLGSKVSRGSYEGYKVSRNLIRHRKIIAVCYSLKCSKDIYIQGTFIYSILCIGYFPLTTINTKYCQFVGVLSVSVSAIYCYI